MDTRHLLGGIIVLLVFLATLSAGCLNQQDATPEKYYPDQFNPAKNLAKNISVQIDTLDDALIAATRAIANDKYNQKLVYQEFGKVYVNYQAVEAFMIIDEHNRIINVCPVGNKYLTSFVGEIATGLTQNYSTDAPIITTATFEYGNRTVMANLLPMISANGTSEGVLVAVIDKSLFYEEIVHTFQMETQYNAWIIDEQGRILYYPDEALPSSGVLQLKSPNQTELDRVLQTILMGESGVETYNAYDYGKLKLTSQVAAWDTFVTTNNKNHDPIVIVTSEIERTSQVTRPVKSANIELQEFVHSAYLFAKQNGKAAALTELGNPDGIISLHSISMELSL